MILSFTCNGLTRRIQRLENAVVAVRQDSNVDTVRMIFRPEEFNNISLSTVSVKFLYVDNTDGEIKAYQTGTTPDGGVYVADWELTDDVVDDAGYINFAVKLAVVNGDTVEKQWFSIPDTFGVYDSVDDTNNPPGETVAEQATNAEKIAQLQSQLGTATSELSSLTSTVALQDARIEAVRAAVDSAIHLKLNKPTDASQNPYDGTDGQFLRSNGDGTTRWGSGMDEAEVSAAVTEWLEENVSGGETIAVDKSLTVTDAAADAKVVGDGLTNLKVDLEYLTVDLNHIKLTNSKYYGITFSSTGNVCSISGTSTNAFTFALGTFTPEIGKTYVFEANAEPVSTAWYLFLTGVNGTSTWYKTGKTFTCTTDGAITVRIQCPANTTINATVSPCVPEYPILTAKYLDSKIDSNLNQIAGIKTEISEISSVLPHKEVKETVIDADTEGWESGYYYSGSVGSTIKKSAYAQLACRIYGNVSKGDRFEVTARSIGSGYAIILCDSSGKIIENFVSPANNGYYDLAEYTASADGIIYLNTAIVDYLDGNKRYNLSKIESELTPVESSLNGVKWYSIGDSLNEFNTTAEQNWIKYMIAGTGADNTNVAASGSGFYRGSPLEGYNQTNYIKQLERVGSDAELITIAGSFNDLMTSPWATLPVGTASDTGTESIAGYMNTFFDTLISNFPNTAIAVVMTSPWDVFKPGVEKSDNYVSVLKAICEKHGIPFYSDCYYGCNLRPWNAANKTEYYTRSNGNVDGVHPNSKGHVFIYRMIRPFLEKVVHVVP